MKTFLTLILTIATVFSTFAQFEGKIVFESKLQGEGAEQLAAFAPKSYVYQVKGNDILFKMNGGMAAMMLGEILVNGNDQTSYMLKHAEKKAIKITGDEVADDKSGVKPKIIKEDEVIIVVGYSCQKYRVESGEGEGKLTQYLWVTDEIKIKPPKKGAPKTMKNVFIEGLEGFPLKIKVDTEAMGTRLTMTMTAIEVDETKLDKSLFKIPSDYVVEDLDPAMFQQMMGF